MEIGEPEAFVRLTDGRLSGEGVIDLRRTLGDLKGIFADEDARAAADQNQTAYLVQAHMTEEEGKEGGLFMGTTFLYPGRVGNEYFMTKGHFHGKTDAAEYYWCIGGKGVLMLMDEDRNCRAEKMCPGSLHYIRGRVAHRIANTGDEVLAVGTCCPSDAGHDYETIASEGFSCRVVRVDGKPHLVRA